jgi:hypothetical protein
MSVVIPSLRAAIAVPPWVKNELWRRAQALPSLDLRFADNKSLVDAVTGASLITFTRASNGTYVDSAGVIQTAATNVPRFDHNPITGESLGLLVEAQRTNLVLNSATFQPTSGGTPAAYTVDQVAPDGTTTGSRQTAANPRTFVDYTGIANALYTFSFYCRVTSGTAAFSIQLKNATTDTVITSDTGAVATTTWRRFTISGTTAGATPGARVELIGVAPGLVFWGDQLEEGAFPTSYIPTTTATVTRSADVASITGSAFSGWYRQDEGTFYGEATGLSSGATITVRASADAGERIQFVNGLGQTAVISAAAAQAIFGSPGTNKQAFAFKANDFAQKRVGVALETDSSGTLPVVDMATIGKFDFGGLDSLNGHIRRLVFWPVRSPNTTLEALTQ